MSWKTGDFAILCRTEVLVLLNRALRAWHTFREVCNTARVQKRRRQFVRDALGGFFPAAPGITTTKDEHDHPLCFPIAQPQIIL